MQWGIRIAGMDLTELKRIIHTARTVLTYVLTYAGVGDKTAAYLAKFAIETVNVVA